MLVYARSLAAEGRVDPAAIAAAYNSYYTAPQNTSRGYNSYYDNATKGFLANVGAGRTWPHTGNIITLAVTCMHPLAAALSFSQNTYRLLALPLIFFDSLYMSLTRFGHRSRRY